MLNDFAVGVGQEFKILDIDGSSSGLFTGLPEDAFLGNFGEDLFITYAGGDGNDVVLYSQGLAGDFDFDQDVDGFDFLKWQRGESPVPLSTADLLDWNTNYGVGPISATASPTPIPEPKTSSLLGMILASVLAKGHRHF